MFFLPSFRAACQGQCGSLVDVSQGQKSDPSRSSLSFSEGGAPTSTTPGKRNRNILSEVALFTKQDLQL